MTGEFISPSWTCGWIPPASARAASSLTLIPITRRVTADRSSPPTRSCCSATTSRKPIRSYSPTANPWRLRDSHQSPCIPQGHCLGSAQTLVVSKATGHRLLYTLGISKLVSARPTNRRMPVRADTLVIECTYGRPEYVFPGPGADVCLRPPALFERGCPGASGPSPWAGGWARHRRCCTTCCLSGFEVVAEEGIYRAVEAYREAGIKFPGKVAAFDGHWPDGTVALFPPGKSVQALRGVSPPTDHGADRLGGFQEPGIIGDAPRMRACPSATMPTTTIYWPTWRQ